ncbi:MAG: hypothetical protein ACFE75_09070 [Candidatus Hodarchaeota archaeon]
MNNKNKLLIIIVCTIIGLGLISRVRAIDYSAGIKEGRELIWICNIYQKQKMEQLFGNDWDKVNASIFKDLEEGAKMKWKITDIIENAMLYSNKTKNNESALSIKFDIWNWTKNVDWGPRDSQDERILFKNPLNNLDHLIYPNFVPFWLPVPTGEYMKAMEPVLSSGYTIDGRVLLAITIELDKNELDGTYPTEYVKVLAMYNDEGILRSYKLYITDHFVMVDISLESNPILEIPLIIIIVVLSYFGLTIVLLKTK